MLYFKTRSLARSFASKVNRKVYDAGAGAEKRWAVKVV